jgi:hypothetical protein
VLVLVELKVLLIQTCDNSVGFVCDCYWDQHQFDLFPDNPGCVFGRGIQTVRLRGVNPGLYVDFVNGALRKRRREVRNHGYSNEPHAE